MRLLNKLQSGSTLMFSMICAAVLGTVGVATFYMVEYRYRTVHQSASWRKSLLATEAGLDLAMNEIRRQLYDPANAWVGWRHDINAEATGEALPVLGGAGEATTYYYTSSALLQEDEGGTRTWVQVAVDAPPSLVDSSGEQWYRIRSTGSADVPGGAVANADPQDSKLRRLSLFHDRFTGRATTTPRASRMVEAIAKPVGAFRVAIFGNNAVNMNNHNIVVDSYDSRDPQKSTNGRYDITKRQHNGHVATNGQMINAGSAHVYGDVMTNGGTAINTNNVTGDIKNDFYQELFTVTAPAVTPEIGSPVEVSGGAELEARADRVANYVLSSVSLAGQSKLRIKGAADGSRTYAQLIVNGNMSVSGQGAVQLDPGVFVRIFVKGNVDIAGNGFVNPNSALALQLYGTDRPAGPNGEPTSFGTMKIAGNGGFSGAIYAPNYNIEIKGGGNSDTVYGAVAGHTVSMTGVQSVHYDEALADGGLVSDYKIVSWFEDER